MDMLPMDKQCVVVEQVEGNSINSILFGFIRPFRVTPAMEAGITDHVWSFEELIALLDAKSPTNVA